MQIEDETPEKCDHEDNEPIKSHKTVENSKVLVENSETIIPKYGTIHKINIKRPTYSSPVSTPYRKSLIDEFITSLPESIETNSQI
jgi:hypothetical protein